MEPFCRHQFLSAAFGVTLRSKSGHTRLTIHNLTSQSPYHFQRTPLLDQRLGLRDGAARTPPVLPSQPVDRPA